MSKDLYARAGIDDVAEFYRTKFVSDEVLDPRYFRPLDRFNMHFARTMWVFDNVRAGARVLDVGCGAGLLALLKRKRVALAGVDLSDECARAARANGYDYACRADLRRLPFADASFDYVVSLDVLGHVTAEDKDAVVSEMRRVLRPAGVTMHGIECIDLNAQKSYDEMTQQELRRFIKIDGHVGLEEEEVQAARFRRYFAHVEWQPRYALCMSSDEFVKQSDEYGLPFERDFVDYLRGLSQKERRAFDMAMGYVFAKVSDLNVRLPESGLYMFLKASDAPLGRFNNEHRDRSTLFAGGVEREETASFCLDRDPHARFDAGWHEPNLVPPVARWMGERARVRFSVKRVSSLRLDLTTHLPALSSAQPVRLEFFLNGARVSDFSLFRYGWMALEIMLSEAMILSSDEKDFELEIRASRTWQPRPEDREDRDDRELSIAVCNIEVFA